jgi:uncharacterized protein (TIGR02246 family)
VSDDERAIRELVDTWLAASAAGDLPTVLKLIDDDAVFMVPGREPFGKAAFADVTESMKDARMKATSEIREIKVLGDWAYMRTHLKMTMTPPGADQPMRRSGYTLTILRRTRDGRWVLARDANLLTAQA